MDVVSHFDVEENRFKGPIPHTESYSVLSTTVQTNKYFDGRRSTERLELCARCLLRLLDAVTDGSEFEINPTGTELTFRPGQLVGGSAAKSESGCCCARFARIPESSTTTQKRDPWNFLLSWIPGRRPDGDHVC